MRAARSIALCAAFGVAGCSLFVSLDGLSDHETSDASPMSDASSNAESSSTNDAAAQTDASDGSLVFVDDFNRPDATSIGNAWIEKNPTAFVLGGGQVIRGLVSSVDYPDNMVYRPTAEDVGDSEISLELIFQAGVSGYPQIHSRIQENTIGAAGFDDSYLLYIPDDATQMVVSRTRNFGDLSDLVTQNLDENMMPGQRYRLTLRVTGRNPVSLFGIVEHFESGAWTTIGQATTIDTDTTRLDDAGSVGFSGSTKDVDPYHYDNFMRTPL